MKLIYCIFFLVLVIQISSYAGERDPSSASTMQPTARMFSLEPAIGINPMPLSDVSLSAVVQYNIAKRWSVVSHSSYNYYNAFVREFNFIETNYNYSFNQKFGIGVSVSKKHLSHTFSFMAGAKYDAFKETMNNPEFEKVSVVVQSVSPDVGLLYQMKIGAGKYFCSYRIYLPLYPYPFKSKDIQTIDANLANTSLEFGVGIRWK